MLQRHKLGEKVTRPRRAIVVATTAGALLAIGAVAIAAAPAENEGSRATKLSVRMDYYAGPEQAGFWVAKAKGWYDAAGLDVNVEEGQGSDTTAQLVAAGKDTFGYVSGDALLRAAAKGEPLVMLAMPVQDAGFAIVVRATSGIKKPKDLEGRKYGDAAGSASIGLLHAFCAATKIRCNKIKIIYVPTQAIIPGFFSHKFDAIEANDWWPSGYNTKGPVRFIPYRKYGVPTPGWGIVAQKKMLQDDPATVRNFVQVTLRGFAYAYSHPTELHPIVAGQVKTYYYDAKANVAALKAFVRHTPNTKGKPLGWMSANDWRKYIRIYGKYAGLKNVPPPGSIFTNGYIRGD
jgi:NitT/TauT family transport system substrate-binding protein